MRYENLCKKYDVTVEEIDYAINQIAKNGIAKFVCDTNVLLAAVDLMANGDIQAEVANGNN